MKKQVTKKKLLKQINRFELRIITDDSTKIYDISEILTELVQEGESLAPDAAALWKLSATKFKDGLDYIKQNDHLVS